MNKKTKQIFEERATIIKALAHPTRLFIVEELSKDVKCVCELTDSIGADISTVSKHLAILKKAGIVVDDKQGLQVWYSLKVPCVMNFFSCVKSVIDANSTKKPASPSHKLNTITNYGQK